MKKTIMVLVSVCMLAVAGICEAASTSGGIILKEGVGARAQGMGEAFAGIADDSSSLYWNVGGLSQVQGMEVSTTYLMGIAESAQQHLAFACGLGEIGTLGLGVSMLQGGMIELDLAGGGTSEVQSQSDLVIIAGYGSKLRESLGVGLAVKFLSSNLIEEYSAIALAADFGVKLDVNEELSVGVALQNVGTEIVYEEEGDALPMTARVGAGYAVAIADQHDATLGVDLVKANDRDLTVHMGTEYWYDKMLAVRLGYKAGYDLDGLTAGIGFHMQQFQLDYAFSLVQELNSTHKITLSVIM